MIRGITIAGLARYLKISRPTAGSYASAPDRMRTRHRHLLAKWEKLGLTLTEIDGICNGTVSENSIVFDFKEKNKP